jgi:8-oxo-dGTP pyrophosphatase MutT (NUDIX family)
MTYVGAGIIISQPLTNTYLLLKGRSGIWSFPKGHSEIIDKGDLKQTAIRETFEETGLGLCDYTITDKSRRFGKCPYWMGFVDLSKTKSTIRINKDEHSEYKWFTITDIQQLAKQTNCDVRSWLLSVS